MINIEKGKLLILPDLKGDKGGPTYFFNMICKYLTKKQIRFTHEYNKDITHVFIINGTRKIILLLYLYLRRIPITVRLGSYNLSTANENKGYKERLISAKIFFATNFSVFLCNMIIYQSKTVRDQWTKSWFAKSKPYKIIYNPAPFFDSTLYRKNLEGNLVSNHNSITSEINIISMEGNHLSPEFSLPFKVYKYIKKNNKFVNIHLFGAVNSKWDSVIETEFNLINHGYCSIISLIKEVNKINMPIYIPSDTITMGCPNSLILMQALSVPAVVVRNTPAEEIIKLNNGGLSCFYSDCKSKKPLFSDLYEIYRCINNIMADYKNYSANALRISEILDQDKVFCEYLKALNIGQVNNLLNEDQC